MPRLNSGNGTETATDIAQASSSIALKLTWNSLTTFTASDHYPGAINTTSDNFLHLSKLRRNKHRVN